MHTVLHARESNLQYRNQVQIADLTHSLTLQGTGLLKKKIIIIGRTVFFKKVLYCTRGGVSLNLSRSNLELCYGRLRS
eukprot:SAG31_NODE_134_length_23213_cov_5.698624_15_plen_78_part_00